MKLWLTGHELLKINYHGDKVSFFQDIEDGKRVPHRPDSVTPDGGGLRIFPQALGELLGKISLMESISEFLNKTDEEYLKDWFLLIAGGDEEEAERLIFEEGPRKLEDIAKIRPVRKQEFFRLRNEIGVPEEVLSPAKVWRNVILTAEDQIRLLDACYLIGQENGVEQKGPKGTGKDVETNTEFPNSFIKIDDKYWRVKFEGDKEVIINDGTSIKTLLEYLRNEYRLLDKTELYSRLHTEPDHLLRASTEEQSVHGFEGMDGQDNYEVLDDKGREDIEEGTVDLVDRIETKKKIGKLEESEELQDKLEKAAEGIKISYGGDVDLVTGKISWPRNNTTFKKANRTSENIPRHINNAKALFKKKGMTNLYNHLDNYLNATRSIYSPPNDFQGWHISD